MDIGLELLLLLAGVAFIAGIISAMVGGSSLVTLPILMILGLNPVTALATNKFQTVFSPIAAIIAWQRQGMIRWREIGPAIILAGLGSVLGALLVQQIPLEWLNRLLPIFFILMSFYLLLRPSFGRQARQPTAPRGAFTAVAAGIGFYDGLLGLGTGAFFTMAGVSLRGMDLVQATAAAKPIDLASNAAATLTFIVGGHVLWTIGLVMAVAQFAGGWVGTRIVMRHGTGLVRWLLVVLCSALSLRLAATHWLGL